MLGWFAQADIKLGAAVLRFHFSLTIPAKVQSYMACAKPIVPPAQQCLAVAV
jgi:hypothetical protein